MDDVESLFTQMTILSTYIFYYVYRWTNKTYLTGKCIKFHRVF